MEGFGFSDQGLQAKEKMKGKGGRFIKDMTGRIWKTITMTTKT